MKLNPMQFLDIYQELYNPETSAAAVLPFPYEGGVSYGRGTAGAPDAILEASAFLEFYDEVLETEPCNMGITTFAAPAIPPEPEKMIRVMYESAKELIAMNKFTIVLGGDHSISSGYFRALLEKYGTLSCIQIDAHSDLRDQYEESPLSHASVMARIREMTQHTLQLGIRSMCVEESTLIREQNLAVYPMHKVRSPEFDLQALLDRLPDPVFITFDVDAFDWSVVSSTGTPEPGGFTWDEAMSILHQIFHSKNVVGADVVELSHSEYDRNSPFAMAKLVYKMLGFKLSSVTRKQGLPWPKAPSGNILL